MIGTQAETRETSHDTLSQQESCRLTAQEIAILMRDGDIPLVVNDCLRRFRPLARLAGRIQCVREELTPYCAGCAFFPSRTSTLSQPEEKGLKLVEREVWPIEFEAVFRELSKDRQYNFNLPIDVLRQHSNLLGMINRRFKISIKPVGEG